MKFFHSVPPLDERALSAPAAMDILALIAERRNKQLRAPLSLMEKRFRGNVHSVKAAFLGLLNAEFITPGSRPTPKGGNEYTDLELTAKGWAAIGEQPPLWEAAQ